MTNKQLAEALRAIDMRALWLKDRAAVLNAAEALEIEVAQAVTDERAAFEKEFSGWRLTRGANGLYDNPATGFAWKVWQARASLSAAASKGDAQ